VANPLIIALDAMNAIESHSERYSTIPERWDAVVMKWILFVKALLIHLLHLMSETYRKKREA